MKAVLDTNVIISGIFFGGLPAKILDAFADNRFDLVLSNDILDEYVRVAKELSKKFPSIDYDSPIQLLVLMTEIVDAPPLPTPVCRDPDDDKFISCAISSKAKIIVSGDKDLLASSGYLGISIIKPRAFLDSLE